MELAVYVAAYLLHVSAIRPGKTPGLFPYCDRRADCDDISLFYQQLACLVTYLADLGLRYRTTCSKLCDGSEYACQHRLRGLETWRSGCAHLSRSLILTAAAAAQPQQKAGMQLRSGQWDARITHAQIDNECRKSGIVGRPSRYQKWMVERAIIGDGISDDTVIEAVAISAEFPTPDFPSGADQQLDCRDYQPQSGANDARRQVPSRWPARSLPAAEGPMRWQSLELPSRFSHERIDLRQTQSLLHGR